MAPLVSTPSLLAQRGCLHAGCSRQCPCMATHPCNLTVSASLALCQQRTLITYMSLMILTLTALLLTLQERRAAKEAQV